MGNALQPIVKIFGENEDMTTTPSDNLTSYTSDNMAMANSYDSSQSNSPSLAKHSMSQTMTPEPPTLLRHRSHTDRSRPPSLSVNALNELFRFKKVLNTQHSFRR